MIQLDELLIGQLFDLRGVGFDPESEVDLKYVVAAMLFSESNTRFVVELEPDNINAFGEVMDGVEIQPIGSVIEQPRFMVETAHNVMIDTDLQTLKSAWLGTLDWN